MNKIIESIYIKNISCDIDNVDYLRAELNQCIVDIDNEIKSRTCENCRYFKNNYGGFAVCSEIGNTTVSKDFGCNRFERLKDV